MNTKLLLIQILRELKSISENPDIEKQIKDYFSLSNQEEKKLNSAKIFIAQADALKAEHDKRAQELAQGNAALKKASELFDEQVKAHNQNVQQLETEKAHLEARVALHKEAMANHDAIVAAHSASFAKLAADQDAVDDAKAVQDERRNKLDKREDELDAEAERLKQLEADLKAKAAKLKKQADEF